MPPSGASCLTVADFEGFEMGIPELLLLLSVVVAAVACVALPSPGMRAVVVSANLVALAAFSAIPSSGRGMPSAAATVVAVLVVASLVVNRDALRWCRLELMLLGTTALALAASMVLVDIPFEMQAALMVLFVAFLVSSIVAMTLGVVRRCLTLLAPPHR